ncbi:MAG: hypothetical protein ACLGHL_05215 [Actinomycetota bacterium]
MGDDRSKIDVESEGAKVLEDREMMSIISGSTGSLIPPTTTGAEVADPATAAASDSPDGASDLPLSDSDASASTSDQSVSSDRDQSATFNHNDSASSTT